MEKIVINRLCFALPKKFHVMSSSLFSRRILCMCKGNINDSGTELT